MYKIVKKEVPHFVVFYNGKEDAPDQYDLRLSDAFEKETKNPEIELVCHVYNINNGKNVPLLSKCQTLREYMYFVERGKPYAFLEQRYRPRKRKKWRRGYEME